MTEKELRPARLNDEIEADYGTQTTPENTSAHSSDLDDNYEIYRQHAGEEHDAAEAKRVLRKIDLRIVPILIMIYFLQYSKFPSLQDPEGF